MLENKEMLNGVVVRSLGPKPCLENQYHQSASLTEGQIKNGLGQWQGSQITHFWAIKKNCTKIVFAQPRVLMGYPTPSGLAGEHTSMQLFNKSWQTSTLPQSWNWKKSHHFHPNTKGAGEVPSQISLLGCLSKTSERMLLYRLSLNSHMKTSVGSQGAGEQPGILPQMWHLW